MTISQIKEYLNKFRVIYEGMLSQNSLRNYLIILDQIYNNTFRLTSKSKYLQAMAVKRKCEEVLIPLPESFILPSKYTKRGDNFKKNVIDKLVPEQALENILKLLPNTAKGKELSLAIMLSYYSGLRLSETISLKPSDIEIKEKVVFNILGKGAKFRKVLFPKDKVSLLNGFRGFRISSKYVQNTLRRIRKRLPLNFSFHSFRHSFATNVLNKKVPIHHLQKLLGHSSLTITQKYLHASDSLSYLEEIGY